MTPSTALLESTRALRDCCEKLERIVADLPGDEPAVRALRFEARVLLERSRTLLALSDTHEAEHRCHEQTWCSCSVQALEPDEDCPVHSCGPWPPRCVECGKFIRREIMAGDGERRPGVRSAERGSETVSSQPFDVEGRTDHGREDEREKRYERLYEEEFVK